MIFAHRAPDPELGEGDPVGKNQDREGGGGEEKNLTFRRGLHSPDQFPWLEKFRGFERKNKKGGTGRTILGFQWGPGG